MASGSLLLFFFYNYKHFTLGFLSSIIIIKAYFRGLIFVVCPEHVIIVAYCLQLLFQCSDFHGLIFHFGALRNENKTQRKSLVSYTVFISCVTFDLIMT